jgi:hypothetical protein
MNIKKASGDVKYEIDMLQQTAELLSKPNFSQTNHDALLESFAIHTRNLFVFFYCGTKLRKKDDVLAEDYLINKKEFRMHRTKKRELNYLTKRIAKLIVHLTYHRAVYNRKTRLWSVTSILKKMNKTIDAFMNSLPEKRKIWFK